MDFYSCVALRRAHVVHLRRILNRALDMGTIYLPCRSLLLRCSEGPEGLLPADSELILTFRSKVDKHACPLTVVPDMEVGSNWCHAHDTFYQTPPPPLFLCNIKKIRSLGTRLETSDCKRNVRYLGLACETTDIQLRRFYLLLGTHYTAQNLSRKGWGLGQS